MFALLSIHNSASLIIFIFVCDVFCNPHTGDGGHTLRIDPAWDREHDITLVSSVGPTVLLKLMLH